MADVCVGISFLFLAGCGDSHNDKANSSPLAVSSVAVSSSMIPNDIASSDIMLSSSAISLSSKSTSSISSEGAMSSSSTNSSEAISDVALGRQYYNSLCSVCHGSDGAGGARQTPLNPASREGRELAIFIRDTMPNNNTDACDQRCAESIVAYVLTFLKPSISEGELIYQRLCIGCHGDNGIGIVGRGPALASSTQPLDAQSAFIDSAMPPSDASACTSQCAVDVASYIATFSDSQIE